MHHLQGFFSPEFSDRTKDRNKPERSQANRPNWRVQFPTWLSPDVLLSRLCGITGIHMMASEMWTDGEHQCKSDFTHVTLQNSMQIRNVVSSIVCGYGGSQGGSWGPSLLGWPLAIHINLIDFYDATYASGWWQSRALVYKTTESRLRCMRT